MSQPEPLICQKTSRNKKKIINKAGGIQNYEEQRAKKQCNYVNMLDQQAQQHEQNRLKIVSVLSQMEQDKIKEQNARLNAHAVDEQEKGNKHDTSVLTG